MNTQDLRKRWDDLRQTAEEVRLQLHLATMDAKKYWEDDVEPALARAQESLEERVEHTAELREQLFEQVSEKVRRIRDEIKSRLGSTPSGS